MNTHVIIIIDLLVRNGLFVFGQIRKVIRWFEEGNYLQRPCDHEIMMFTL